MKQLITTLLALGLTIASSLPSFADDCVDTDSPVAVKTDTPVAVKAEAYYREPVTQTITAEPASLKEAALRGAMRELWEEHITWTRLYIVSAAGDLPDKQATALRLLQNQTDIGNAIKPYFGNAAGTQLTVLLKEHITIATEVVTAAKAGNKPKLAAANLRWFANADAIAGFLGTANPDYWVEADVKHMLHEHLNATTAQAVAQLNGDWVGSIAAYDKVHDQALLMADGLSDGIIGKYPDQF